MHESELNYVKQQIFSELETMTPDQHRELVKAFVNDILDISIQTGTLANTFQNVSRQLDTALELPNFKQLKRAVKQCTSQLVTALDNYSTANTRSAALLKQRLLSIDPNIIRSEMTRN